MAEVLTDSDRLVLWMVEAGLPLEPWQFDVVARLNPEWSDR